MGRLRRKRAFVSRIWGGAGSSGIAPVSRPLVTASSDSPSLGSRAAICSAGMVHPFATFAAASSGAFVPFTINGSPRSSRMNGSSAKAVDTAHSGAVPTCCRVKSRSVISAGASALEVSLSTGQTPCWWTTTLAGTDAVVDIHNSHIHTRDADRLKQSA